jgi:lysophospholipase L1-like esterase
VRSLRRWAASVTLAVATAAVALVVAEGAYRGVAYLRYRIQLVQFVQGTWRLLPGDPLLFALPPHHDGRMPMAEKPSVRVPYRTNMDGFRGPEWGPRRPGVARVVVLGDSYTFGWGVRDDEPYPERAEALLRAEGRAVEVLNLGVPGYNTELEFELLRRALPRYEPDVVVLGYAVNDAEPQSTVPVPPRVRYRDAVSWMWEDAKSLLNRGLPPGRRFHIRKLEPSMDYADGFQRGSEKWQTSRLALRAMARLCEERHVPLVVLVLPDTTQAFGFGYPDFVVHEAVASWTGEIGVRTVDLLTPLLGRDHLDYMVPGDGHPNARAHEEFARVLRDEIVRALGPRAEPGPRAQPPRGRTRIQKVPP